MATLYLKAAGGNASAAGTWSSTGSGGGDSSGPPTAADNVILEAGSGALTINANTVCRSFDCTSGTGIYANTVTFTSPFGLTIGDATAGAGNVAFKLSTTTTLSFGSQTGCPISCNSTSATQQTITFAGKTTGNFYINGVGSSYLLSDATTLTPNSTFALYAGTIDTNNLAHSWGLFNTLGSGTKVLNLGTSTITMTGTAGTPWNCATNTGLTTNASSSTINYGAASATNRAFGGGVQTYGVLNYTVAGSSGLLALSGAGTVIGTLNVGSGRGLTINNNITVNNWNVNGANNGYQYFPGSGYASTPDSVALSIVGDFELQVRVVFTATTGVILSKYSSGAGNAGWEVAFFSGGFTWKDSIDGSNASYNSYLASSAVVAAAGITAGTTYWFRVTNEVNVASKRKISLFYAADNTTPPTVWTSLGTPLASVATAPNPDTAADVEIGGYLSGTSTLLTAAVYRARILDGIAGTVAFDANFATKAFGANTFVEGSSNAATVTINGTSAQVGDGRVELVGTGTTVTVPSLVDADYLCSTGFTAANRTPFYFGAHSVDRGSNVSVVFGVRPAALPSCAISAAGD